MGTVLGPSSRRVEWHVKLCQCCHNSTWMQLNMPLDATIEAMKMELQEWFWLRLGYHVPWQHGIVHWCCPVATEMGHATQACTMML